MSPRKTRRSVLRTAVGTATVAALAGCGAVDEADTRLQSGDDPADTPSIPGVENRRVTDSESLGAAHRSELRDDSATIVTSDVLLDVETGEPHSAETVTCRVEGDRILATTGNPDRPAERTLFARNDELYERIRRDDDVEVVEHEPGGRDIRPADLLQRSAIEGTLDGYELSGADPEHQSDGYVFRSRTSVSADGDERATAAIDGGGVVYDSHRTTDGHRGDAPVRRSTTWTVEERGSTVVETPGWVDDA